MDRKVENYSWQRALKLKRSSPCLMRRRHSERREIQFKWRSWEVNFVADFWVETAGLALFFSAGGEDAGVIEVWNDEIPENSCSGVEGQEAASGTHSCSKTSKIWRLHMRTGKYLNWYSSDLLHIQLGELEYLLTLYLFGKCWYKRIKKLIKISHP